MEFKDVVKNRYSCKKYSERKVDRARLNEILEAGRLAPTAKNLQEQHIYVVESKENLAKIDKATPCRYGAPTVLVVAFDKNNVFTYPGGVKEIPELRMLLSWQLTLSLLQQTKEWTAAGSISLIPKHWQKTLAFRRMKRF